MNKEEFKILCKSAKSGDDKAQYSLGYCYRYSDDIKQDFEKAVFWLKKSAIQGNIRAQYELGKCYRDGVGIDKDVKKAIYW
jgi:TPR repeat protein